jgi:hypothetical protein
MSIKSENPFSSPDQGENITSVVAMHVADTLAKILLMDYCELWVPGPDGERVNLAQVRTALRLAPEQVTPACNFHATFVSRMSTKYAVQLGRAAALNSISFKESRPVTLSGAA